MGTHTTFIQAYQSEVSSYATDVDTKPGGIEATCIDGGDGRQPRISSYREQRKPSIGVYKRTRIVVTFVRVYETRGLHNGDVISGAYRSGYHSSIRSQIPRIASTYRF